MRAWIAFMALYAATVFVGMVLFTSQALPQSPTSRCMPMTVAEGHLAKQYGETLFAVGVAGESAMRIYVNPDSRSWTLMHIRPAGTACIMAGGSSFDTAKPGKPDGPET